MGEPITIYDKQGTAHTLFGAAAAAQMVASGEYSYEQPAKPTGKAAEEKNEPDKPAKGKGSK